MWCDYTFHNINLGYTGLLTRIIDGKLFCECLKCWIKCGLNLLSKHLRYMRWDIWEIHSNMRFMVWFRGRKPSNFSLNRHNKGNSNGRPSYFTALKKSHKGCTFSECPHQLLFSRFRIQGVCWAVTFCIVGRVSGFDSSPCVPSSANPLQTQQWQLGQG